MSDYDPATSFSLADLAPAPLTFFDEAFGGDGQRHVVRCYNHFGPADLGELRRLERDLQAAYGLLANVADASSPDALEQAGQRLDAVLTRMIELLIPTLPPARLAPGGIPFVGKEHLLRWWTAAQQPALKRQAAQEAGRGDPLARPTPPGNSLPGSLPPTA